MTADGLALLQRLGYPDDWLAEARNYSPGDAYVVFDPDWAEEIPQVPEDTVDLIIRRHAEHRAAAQALIYLDRTLRYGELDDLIGRAAAVLREKGVGRGNVVAVMVPTSAMHWVVFFAIARLGAIHCGVNVMFRKDELKLLFEDAQPSALVCLDHFLPVVDQISKSSKPTTVFSVSLRDLADPEFQPYPSLTEWWSPAAERGAGAISLLEAMDQAVPVHEGAEVDARAEIGQIVYTAGTTGKPKGVVQSHFNLIHNAITHTIVMPTIQRPVTYSALPLFHTGGFFVYSMPTFVRGGTVIPRPLFDPRDALACIENHAVNVFFGPPTLFTALLSYGLDSVDLTSLKVCATGAAPIPSALPVQWEAATGQVLWGGWGMSELNSLGTYNGLPGRPAPGTLGVPVVGEVRIVVDAQVAARGQEGEIEYRGMQVSKGYLGKPAETEAAFRPDGWFRTGDVGRIDDQGFLHYVDRQKDIIVASGYNISPAEIERVLLSHPAISEAAVVGAPHDYRGEVPIAFVVGDVTAEEVQAFCRDRLAAIKVPDRTVVLDQLPKNTMGKTLKRNLLTTGSGR
ncbi:MAG: class I adenylate-forming enzyme family protein [Sciscionella sp.]